MTVTPKPELRPSRAEQSLAAWANARRLMQECLDGKPVRGGRLPTPEETYSPETLRTLAARRS